MSSMLKKAKLKILKFQITRICELYSDVIHKLTRVKLLLKWTKVCLEEYPIIKSCLFYFYLL